MRSQVDVVGESRRRSLLANGATTVMFESTPVYPDAGRYYVDNLRDTIERDQRPTSQSHRRGV